VKGGHANLTLHTTATGSLTPQQAGRMLLEPDTYTDDRLVQRICGVLREQAPISFVDHPEYPPLWAITRHRDIREVELHPDDFIQGRHSFLFSLDQERKESESAYPPSRNIIHMDGEEHRQVRAVTASWFTPKNLRALDDSVNNLARRATNKMAELGGTCDFVQDIAMDYPLQVIMSLLGLPESDYPFMLRVSKAMAGTQDPEVEPELEREDVLAAFFSYFTHVTEQRRAHPTEDLASAIANANLPGDVSLALADTVWYYIIFALAGHDTTTRALAGGLQAFVEHPEQLARLQADAGLLEGAPNEIIRWVTPVKHVCRTTTHKCDIGGHTFQPGDVLFLSYPGANFDPEAFAHPQVFDIGRSPNGHLAFGIGVHFCLGAQLARMEVRALLKELVPRLRSIGLAGEPKLMRSNVIGGLKRLPIHYEMDG
jgi:cytochrome P450